MRNIEIIHPTSKEFNRRKKLDIKFQWNDRPFTLCYIHFDMDEHEWYEERNQWEPVCSFEAWVNFIDLDSGLMYELMALEDLETDTQGNVEAEHIIAMLKEHLDNNGLPEFKEVVQNGITK
jgi:hypothetical protein